MSALRNHLLLRNTSHIHGGVAPGEAEQQEMGIWPHRTFDTGRPPRSRASTATWVLRETLVVRIGGSDI